MTEPRAHQDPRAQRSSRALHDAMLRLLERHPIDQISIGDIAAEADVSRATVFRHFAGKEALLEHVARAQIDTLVELTVPVFDSAPPETAFLATCLYVEQHRGVWIPLLTGGAAGAMRDELLRVSRTVAASRARPNSTVPVELAVSSMTSMIIEGLIWWLSQPAEAVSPEEMARILYRLALGPMAPDPA